MVVEVKDIDADRLKDPKVLAALHRLRVLDCPGMGGPVFFGTNSVRLRSLPEQLARILQRIGKSIRAKVAAANGQIRDTKVRLGSPEARGLLVVVAPPMKLGLRLIAWAAHDEIRKNGGEHVTDLMLIETNHDRRDASGTSCVWFESRQETGFPPVLKRRFTEAWSTMTGQTIEPIADGVFRQQF